MIESVSEYDRTTVRMCAVSYLISRLVFMLVKRLSIKPILINVGPLASLFIPLHSMLKVIHSRISRELRFLVNSS